MQQILDHRRNLVDGFGLPVNTCEVAEKMTGNTPIGEGIGRDSQKALVGHLS